VQVLDAVSQVPLQQSVLRSQCDPVLPQKQNIPKSSSALFLHFPLQQSASLP
jgi:hypothetical protein